MVSNAPVCEKPICFEPVTYEHPAELNVLSKLAEAEAEAADPNTKWMTQDEVFAPIRKRFGYEV